MEKDKTQYRFDHSGRLVYQTEPNGNFLLFAYDLKTGLLSQVITNRNVAMTFTYHEEGSNAQEEPLTMKKAEGTTETDGNTEAGTAEAAKTTVTNYYYQNGSLLYTRDDAGALTSLNLMGLEGNAIATARYAEDAEDSESWYLYNKDVRGSATSIVDNTGAAAAAYDYDEFGNTTVRLGEDFYNELCYTGQVYDKATGLYYYNARYYDPENGRFISQDTYRGETADPGTYHLYAYCANNPINYVDPSGHKSTEFTIDLIKLAEYGSYVDAAFSIAGGAKVLLNTKKNKAKER